MTRALAHRGPDGGGVWISRAPAPDGDVHVGLGHRRLAIVDLSGAGAQPMSTPDGRFTIVFNGEVYNHPALRADLSARHAFRSRSDTEVLLHGWAEAGSAFLDRVEGMFALAIWDARERVLTLARDAFGEKPLFYASLESSFLFASELSAFLADPGFPRAIDPDALDHYLTWSAVPAPWTIFAAARRLPPGCLLRVEAGGPGAPPKLHEAAWFTPRPAADPPATGREARARLRAAIEASVRARLTGDVPVGAFLSGGIDSSILVGVAARASEGTLRTFSVGFEGAGPFDERAFAREVAQMHGTRHTEIALSRRDALAEANALLDTLDEPFGDSSAIPTSLVSRHARAHVKVALSGDGADELFAGYWKYAAEALAPVYAGIPAPLRRALARLAAGLPEDRRTPAGEALRRARKFLTRFDADPAARHAAWMRVFDADSKRALLVEPDGDRFRRTEALVDRLFREAHGADPLAAMLHADLRHTLPTDMLAKVDRMSMRHGLEVRVPYLDPGVVALALAIPSRWKLRGARRKAILIDACGDLLPRRLRRRPKRGFEIPLAEWFRADLRDVLHDTLAEPAIRAQGLLRPGAVARLLREHDTRARDHAARLWNLLVLCAWHRRVIGAGEGAA
jgi:asparagine synthase (glutamine-hydrolysing)